MRDGRLGQMMTPGANSLHAGVQWAADNGCFNDKWTEEKWLRFLTPLAGESGCLFAVVPDVVADHRATLTRWSAYSNIVKDMGFLVAFVAQDGATSSTIPWDEFDCLFIGGTTQFKVGAVARHLGREAKARKKWLHMGRVNTAKRICYATGLGCDSVDGTYLKFGPDVNLPRLLKRLERGAC